MLFAMHFPLPNQLVYDDGHRRLTLRPARAIDAGALVEAIHESHDNLRAFMPWAHLEHTEASQTERLVALEAGYHEGGDLVFHAFAGGAERFVGCFGFHDRTLNSRAVEIGFWVRTGAAGQGLATLGTQMLVVLAYDHYGCERVQCAYNEANTASRRVNEKVGFICEGRLRYFELQGDNTLREHGYRVGPVTVMNAIARSDLAGLEWLDQVRKRLTVDLAP